MRICITDDDGTVFAIHQIDATNAGHFKAASEPWAFTGFPPDADTAESDVECFLQDLRAAACKAAGGTPGRGA